MGQVKRHPIALVLDVAEPGVAQNPTGYQHIPDRSAGIHNDDKPYGGQASGWDEAHDYQACQADDQQGRQRGDQEWIPVDIPAWSRSIRVSPSERKLRPGMGKQPEENPMYPFMDHQVQGGQANNRQDDFCPFHK